MISIAPGLALGQKGQRNPIRRLRLVSPDCSDREPLRRSSPAHILKMPASQVCAVVGVSATRGGLSLKFEEDQPLTLLRYNNYRNNKRVTFKNEFTNMKLFLTGLIALSMVAYSRADGFGTGVGIGLGMALANKVFSGGQPRQRVVEHEHRTVVHERTVVVHEKAAPAPASTTVIVNNNLPAQPVAQPTSVTTVNAKTVTVTNPPAQVTAPAPVVPTVTSPASAQKNLADDTNVN
jgi:hypothetical protein